ncbi:hypothetical protein EJ05DRAFT_476103 [Pseudovirgaria hyperparasitica]|uniref:Uncharacterized protein n=1 Tax=Pseudovirgaria hyperparasitica TaxID=470096 RepID=A0A6A6WAE1_9PEZI|nr:uncharacterized protein EJ05DRAFT_476103 [Pseudovirgaria hyperparasitica]KAF2758796.1 hypothetical protein EJ05DRAFT_476103 [Pseudovirgaria hyperparasitica]
MGWGKRIKVFVSCCLFCVRWWWVLWLLLAWWVYNRGVRGREWQRGEKKGGEERRGEKKREKEREESKASAGICPSKHFTRPLSRSAGFQSSFIPHTHIMYNLALKP